MHLPPCRPRLIALDMDGTICDSSNTIPPENIAALRDCRAAGIKLSVLTGRRRSTLAPQLELLYRECEPAVSSQPWYVATNSGGLVWEYPGWRQLGAHCMRPELAARVVEVLAPHSLNCYVNPASRGGTELIHLRRRGSAEFEHYFARFNTAAEHSSSVEELLACDITQFAMPAADNLVESLAGRLRNAFASDELSVLSMRWPLLGLRALEAYSPSCNKAVALEQICGLVGADRMSCAAAGDDQNDVPMLEWAGHSAAMPHTPEELATKASQLLTGSGPASLAPWLRGLAHLAT